jgi:hypothetical protein
MDRNTLLALLGAAAVLAVVAAFSAWGRFARAKREHRRRFITGYAFPSELRRRLNAAHPDWSFAQIDRVLDGLRAFFLACLAAQSGGRPGPQLGMPSKAVDEAWHEFILMTREYAAFCQKAFPFGRYLHHTPDGQMKTPRDDALANTLRFSRRAGVTDTLVPAAALATGIPLLFMIDRELGLANGNLFDDITLDRLDHRAQQLAARADGGGGDAGGGDSGSSAHGHGGHADGGAGASCGAASCGGGGGGGGGGCGS